MRKVTDVSGGMGLMAAQMPAMSLVICYLKTEAARNRSVRRLPNYLIQSQEILKHDQLLLPD